MTDMSELTDNKAVVFKLFGLTEKAMSLAQQKIAEMYGDKVSFNFSVTDGDVFVQLEFNKSASAIDIDDITKTFLLTFKDFIYANENVSLVEMAVTRLKMGKRLLKTAESFTGGGIANAIVQVPGASEVFYEGLVCYNSEAKSKRLGIPMSFIKEHGVVSKEVATRMVQCLMSGGNCDVAVATTGFASATGKKNEPAGLCFIAVANEAGVMVRKYLFEGDRQAVMRQGANAGLFLLCKALSGFAV